MQKYNVNRPGFNKEKEKLNFRFAENAQQCGANIMLIPSLYKEGMTIWSLLGSQSNARAPIFKVLRFFFKA